MSIAQVKVQIKVQVVVQSYLVFGERQTIIKNKILNILQYFGHNWDIPKQLGPVIDPKFSNRRNIIIFF